MNTTSLEDLPVSGPKEENIILEKKETVDKLSNEERNNFITGIQSAANQDQLRLPSRDIPINSVPITNDAQVNNNYIPPIDNKDYIGEIETMEKVIEARERKDKKNSEYDELFRELEIPMIIALLFFLFRLPIIQKNLIKILPSLFLKDGNFNLGGDIFMSLIFASAFFILTKVFKYLEITE